MKLNNENYLIEFFAEPLNFVILISVIVWLVLLQNFQGDPSIYFIYSRNIAAGHWFQFNNGEFSSGATSYLWSLLLSPAFLTPLPQIALKLIFLVSILLAIHISNKLFKEIGMNNPARGGSLIMVLYFILLPGIFGYETPLIIVLLSTFLLFFNRILHNDHSLKNIAGAGLVLGALPAARPDSLLITIVGAIILIIKLRKNIKVLLLLFTFFTIAFAPSVIYYLYSYVKIASFSTSGYCRAFALSEKAADYHFIKISKESLAFWASFPVILWVVSGFYDSAQNGCELMPHRKILSFAVVIAYFLLVTFISPIAENTIERYMAPAVLFIILFGFLPINDIAGKLSRNAKMLFYAIMWGLPLLIMSGNAFVEKSRNYKYDDIFEKKLALELNQIIPAGSTVLSYEVQNRFFLKPDVKMLSLDGIVDGKVAPYLKSGDMHSFLMKYKPNYWIANNAVDYRKFLIGSVLQKAANGSSDKLGSTETFNGLTFENILVNPEKQKKGFAGWLCIYKITYPDSSAHPESSSNPRMP